VNDDAALDKELEKVDLVISLIPYTYHARVIKGAIRTKKNVVTTSYVSPAMQELEEDAKKAGITVMNEIGLDPVGLPIRGQRSRADEHFSRVSTISTPSRRSAKSTKPEAKSSPSFHTAVALYVNYNLSLRPPLKITH
jgi:Saccharopine dehydrogenase NADP binding domain